MDGAEREIAQGIKGTREGARDEAPQRTVSIPIETTEQDGASSADYSQPPTSVTFASGATSKTITFAASHDTVDDDEEGVEAQSRVRPAVRGHRGDP